MECRSNGRVRGALLTPEIRRPFRAGESATTRADQIMIVAMRVKICGVTTAEDARLAADAGADFVGLVLAASVRRISLDAARRIAMATPRGCAAVLLLRDAPLAEACEVADARLSDLAPAARDDGRAAGAAEAHAWIQLHGGEDAGYLCALRAGRPRLRIIKAIELTTDDESAAAARLDALLRGSAAPDVIILDAAKGRPRPVDAVFRRVSVALAERVGEIPIWRAGGLTPENVADALRESVFAGVDVASGVESSAGVKSSDLVRRFIRAARSDRRSE